MAGEVKEFDTKDILQSLMSDQKKQQSSEEEIHRVIAFYGSSFTLNGDAPLAKVARKFQTETKVASAGGAFVLPPVLFAKMDSPGPLIKTKYKIESVPALKYFVGGEEKASWQKECLPTTEDAIFTKVKEVGLRAVGGEDLVMAEKEKVEKEKAEKAKAAKEKAEKMKAEKAKAEKEKAEKAKAEKEKAEKMKAEKEKRRKRRLKKKAKKEKAEKDKQDKALASPIADGVVEVEVKKATPKKEEKPLAAVTPSIHVPAGEVTGNSNRNTNIATGQNASEKTVKAPVKRFKPGQKLETAEDRRLEREQWLAQLARQRERKRVKENCCKGLFQRLCSECCHWTCPVMIALTVGIYFLLLFILTSEDDVEWFYFVGLGMAYLIYISIGYAFAPPRSLADGRTLDEDEIQEKIDSAREATSAKYGWIVTSYRSKSVIRREKRADGKIYEIKKTERIKDSSHHCNGFLDVTSNTGMSCPLDKAMALVRVRLKMEIPRTKAYMDAFHRWAIDNSTTSDYEKTEGITCDSIRAGEFEEFMCRWSQKRQCREAFLNQNAYWITLILLLNPLYRLVVATVTGLQTYTFRKNIVNFKV